MSIEVLDGLNSLVVLLHNVKLSINIIYILTALVTLAL